MRLRRLKGKGLGASYAGDILVGTAVPQPNDGVLLHFNLTGNRRSLALADSSLADRVADNLAGHDLTESDSLLLGSGVGITTDIETTADGSAYVVSLDAGKIDRIFRR